MGSKPGVTFDDFSRALRALTDDLGHAPSRNEWTKRYHSKFDHFIRNNGYWKVLRHKVLPEVPIADMWTMRPNDRRGRPLDVSDERLLGDIRQFYKNHGRPPEYYDFNTDELYSVYVYYKRFGGLNKIRAKAGVPVIKKGGRNNRKEYMTAADYKKFKTIQRNQSQLRFEALKRMKLMKGRK